MWCAAATACSSQNVLQVCKRFSSISEYPWQELTSLHPVSTSRLLPSASKQSPWAVMEMVYYKMTLRSLSLCLPPSLKLPGELHHKGSCCWEQEDWKCCRYPISIASVLRVPWHTSGSHYASGDKSFLLLVSLGAAAVITWSDPCFQPSQKPCHNPRRV